MPVDRLASPARPASSGYYVCWIQGVGAPDVCYWNSRDAVWSRHSIRVVVTHFEDRRLSERGFDVQ
jgi:hypothetical protein